jgi:hypothetical protein
MYVCLSLLSTRDLIDMRVCLSLLSTRDLYGGLPEANNGGVVDVWKAQMATMVYEGKLTAQSKIVIQVCC